MANFVDATATGCPPNKGTVDPSCSAATIGLEMIERGHAKVTVGRMTVSSADGKTTRGNEDTCTTSGNAPIGMKAEKNDHPGVHDN